MQIYIAKSRQQTGPFSEQQIESKLNSGMVALSDSAWHEDYLSGCPCSKSSPLQSPLSYGPAVSHFVPHQESALRANSTLLP
jgi:hypothetical protein